MLVNAVVPKCFAQSWKKMEKKLETVLRQFQEHLGKQKLLPSAKINWKAREYISKESCAIAYVTENFKLYLDN